VVGAEPYRGDTSPNDLSLHLEAFYKYQVTKNISITPGVIWITAPNQDAGNPDGIIGTVRTTFTF
jgi:carbohydrate-selective porin OprB